MRGKKGSIQKVIQTSWEQNNAITSHSTKTSSGYPNGKGFIGRCLVVHRTNKRLERVARSSERPGSFVYIRPSAKTSVGIKPPPLHFHHQTQAAKPLDSPLLSR